MSPLSEREFLAVQTKGVQEMPRGKKFTAEQIIGKLRKAETGLEDVVEMAGHMAVLCRFWITR
jgi:hypothetical protein